MARAKLTSDNKTFAPFTTVSVTHGGNRLSLAFVLSVAGPLLPAVSVGASSSGRTWDLVGSTTSGRHRLMCFRSMEPANTTGPISFTPDGLTPALMAWSVFEYDGVIGTGANGADAIGKTNPQGGASVVTLSIGAFGEDGSLFAGAIGLTAQRPVNPGGGLSEIDEQPAFLGTLQTEDRSGSGAIDWSWSGPADATALAVEIKPTVPVPPPKVEPIETLIRKFEPILFFDSEERFLPVDAKRYVEHAALWTTEPPHDQISGWGGGTAAPYPRRPKIAAGAIDTENRASPQYIGAQTDTQLKEHFLDLGGWKDKDGTPHPDVQSGAGVHLYANRDAVASRYRDDPKLRQSQFWYHAELIGTDRLRTLASTVRAPDLRHFLDPRSKNPALLCYYLFFPAHAQSVSAAQQPPPLPDFPLPPPTPCTSVRAAEVGGCAGEWGCIALLLDRPNADADYAPVFVGMTGLQTPADPATKLRRPQAFDNQLRCSLKVEKWNPAGLPHQHDGHPEFFVSLGTHSIYMEPGPHPVDPFRSGTQPVGCATYEGDPPPVDVDDDWDWGWILLKLALGPIGLVAGMIELANGTAVGSGPSLSDLSPDDQTGTGITVHPKGIAVPASWLRPTPWTSEQNLDIDGRKYNFIVDRDTQGWWPSDDGRSGYRGRWGPRVEDDPVRRRAGMRFPQFWEMFLLAWADGLSSGLL